MKTSKATKNSGQMILISTLASVQYFTGGTVGEVVAQLVAVTASSGQLAGGAKLSDSTDPLPLLCK